MVYFRKFNHVSAVCWRLEWLSVESVIQHYCLLMLHHHYHAETENTILLNHPFNLADSPTMKPELPHTLLCHIDLDFHLYTEIFSIQKGPTGGTICQL